MNVIISLVIVLFFVGIPGLFASLDNDVQPRLKSYTSCSTQGNAFIIRGYLNQAIGDTKPQAIMAGTNFAAPILFWTNNQIIGGNYHRNLAGMKAVYTFMSAKPAEAKAILIRRDINYILLCTDNEFAGNSFAHQLIAGNIPNWITPVKVDKKFTIIKLYRVNQKLLK